jgi:polyphosphate kinase
VSQAGVRIELIVRGICCLIPGVRGLSANVRARSIIDRFLEHGRVYLLHAGGEERCYLASADLMTRNLDHRVEVAFPILDDEARRQVRAIVRLQLDDDRKARRLGDEDADPSPSRPGGKRRAQVEIYEFLRGLVGVAAPESVHPEDGPEAVEEEAAVRASEEAKPAPGIR